jgi:transposase
MGGGITTALPGEVERLQQLVTELRQQNSYLSSRATALEEELRLLRNKIFGRRSEQLSAEELKLAGLFNETELPPPTAQQSGASVEVAAHRRAKPGRKPLPADLPREEVVHDIPEEEKTCSCCGAPLVRIGEETSEKLDVVPVRMKVIRHIRPKYACKKCEGAESEHPVKIAPVPAQIIEKSIVTPGLLAFILVAKFCDAIPFYRQERQFARIGVELSRADFCHWAMEVGGKCDPLIEIFIEQIRAGPVVQMDETRLQVMNELDRANTTLSYMWVMRGGPPETPLVLYRYHPSRSASIPLQYLGDYKGFLQTDGYEGYNEVGSLPGIIHVGCWAHTRRKFDEAAKASKNAGSAHEALGRIAKIYRIERDLRALQLSPQEFVRLRKEQVLPILQDFRQWLEIKALQVPPSVLLGKAVAYAIGEWPKLLRYLDSPYLTPDTNEIERHIRPFVIGRSNWIFSGSPRGAHASATLYSLIQTARANGVEPYRYLRYLFTKLPLAQTREDYLALTPQYLNQVDFEKSSL